MVYELMMILNSFPLTNKKLTKIWVMKMKRGKFYLLKKRKEQEYFETESKVKYHLRNRFRSKTTFKI
ncbi:hypothetical protein Avbf_15442 [Armadillidium vulgare]|nr:hypothetical protein Avbf_15442 [Armadillidium vulgare]